MKPEEDRRIDPSVYLKVYDAYDDYGQSAGLADLARRLAEAFSLGRLKHGALLLAVVIGVAAGVAFGIRKESAVPAEAEPARTKAVQQTPAEVTRVKPPAGPSVATAIVGTAARRIAAPPIQTVAAVQTNIDRNAKLPALNAAPAVSEPVFEPKPRSPAILQAALLSLLPAVRPNYSPAAPPRPAPAVPLSVAMNPALELAVSPMKLPVAVVPAVQPSEAKAAPMPVAKLDFRDPQPLRKVIPTRLAAAVLLYRDVNVAVKVSISPEGQVTAAQAVAASNEKVNESVIGTALTAARQWIFKPGTLRGRPVASETVLVFRFHAPQ